MALKKEEEMPLKRPDVRHVVATGTVYELNFHVSDMLKDGYTLEKVAVIKYNEPDQILQVLYVFIK